MLKCPSDISKYLDNRSWSPEMIMRFQNLQSEVTDMETVLSQETGRWDSLYFDSILGNLLLY